MDAAQAEFRAAHAEAMAARKRLESAFGEVHAALDLASQRHPVERLIRFNAVAPEWVSLYRAMQAEQERFLSVPHQADVERAIVFRRGSSYPTATYVKAARTYVAIEKRLRAALAQFAAQAD